MIRLMVAAAMLLALSSDAMAQFDYRIVESQAVIGLKDIQKVGDTLLVSAESQPEFTPVVVLYINTDDVDVEAELADRTPAMVNPEPYQGDGVAYMFTEPGVYFVTMEQLKIVDGAIKRVKRRAKIEVKSAAPELPEDVDVKEYEQIIKAVMPMVRNMDPASKQRTSEILRTAADKMRAFEFKTMEQVGQFISSNRPRNQATDAMFRAISADARSRPPMSWQQAQEYYLVVTAMLDI